MQENRTKYPDEERRIRNNRSSARYKRTNKGKQARMKYNKSEKGRQSTNRHRSKLRTDPQYREWEALMRKARRLAEGTGETAKNIASAWGIGTWREWKWKSVDYSVHDINEVRYQCTNLELKHMQTDLQL